MLRPIARFRLGPFRHSIGRLGRVSFAASRFLDPGERVVVAGHFSDFTGKYVIHCHMLDHEDHGLMSQFEVVAPPSPG